MASISPYTVRSQKRNGELSRLLAAAVINRGFCKMLLTDPEMALATGYNGESFRLASEEQALVLSIQAKSLADFASQLTGAPAYMAQ